MKLSEAIRKGGEQTIQIKYEYINENDNRCALGAAALAIDPEVESDISKFLDLYYKELRLWGANENDIKIFDPICNMVDSIAVVVACLNDQGDWSFDEIADYLETYEL